MTDAPGEEKAALEHVIRSFSDAEVALQEIAAEAKRIRSASQQLGAAQQQLEGSNQALAELAGAIAGSAEQLNTSAEALTATAQRLADLDPDRVHAQLTALHSDIEVSTKTTGDRLTKLADEAHIERTRFTKEEASRSMELAEQLAAIDERLGRQGRMVGVVLLIALVAAAASVYAALIA